MQKGGGTPMIDADELPEMFVGSRSQLAIWEMGFDAGRRSEQKKFMAALREMGRADIAEEFATQVDRIEWHE